MYVCCNAVSSAAAMGRSGASLRAGRLREELPAHRQLAARVLHQAGPAGGLHLRRYGRHHAHTTRLVQVLDYR